MGKPHLKQTEGVKSQISAASRIPPSPQNSSTGSETTFLQIWGRTRDAVKKNLPLFMKPYSTPVLRTNDPKKWYVEFYYDLPQHLVSPGQRKRKRFKIYGEINKLTGKERLAYANALRSDLQYALDKLGFNPFKEEEKAIEVVEISNNLSVEDNRKLTSVKEAFKAYIGYREQYTKNRKSIVSMKTTIKWLEDYFKSKKLLDLPISKVTRLHIFEALEAYYKERERSNVTYNNQLVNANTIFNWLASNDYIDVNPAKGKIKYLPEENKIHRWYDKDTARLVKKALLEHGQIDVYRACQFTYWMMVRSQSELQELKIGDIDFDLKRIRFRAEMSKTNREAFRDYPEDFGLVLEEMGLRGLPADWYIFGHRGKPSPKRMAKELLARRFRMVREKIKLSDEYTIYGWKHTRVCHLMMKGVDGYQISYLARHTDAKSTEAYKRDYDFTLTNVYDDEDLTF